MDCEEYIEQHLSADADGELSAGERLAVERHLAACAECRRRLADERALKVSLHRQLGMVKTPADVRLRIRAALGEIGDYAPAARAPSRSGGLFSRRHAAEAQPLRARLRESLIHVRYAAPLALVLLVLTLSVAVFTAKDGQMASGPTRPVPVFDFAISEFNQLSQGFMPNVPSEAFSREGGAYFAWVEDSNPIHHVSDELPDISTSYEKAQMPPEMCDFAIAGYRLEGGRIDHLPDGRPVTYTLYQNGPGTILSIGLKQRMSAPEGAVYWFESHALYSYKGYSISLTSYPTGHYVSIIVTNAPMLELLHDLAEADVSNLAQ